MGRSADEGARARAFVLSVDELGSFLVARGDGFVLGHVRGGRADLPFLADVGARHARLERHASFRAGTTWRLAPLDGESVRVGGAPIGESGRVLAADDEVELGVNLAFRFRVPDPAGTSVVLQLLRGTDCLGCGGILLFGDGEPGEVVLGAGRRAHLRVAAAPCDVRLRLEGDVLLARAKSGVAEPGAAPSDVVTLRVPPPQRLDLSIRRPAAGPGLPPAGGEPGGPTHPPFGLAFLPLPPGSD